MMAQFWEQHHHPQVNFRAVTAVSLSLAHLLTTPTCPAPLVHHDLYAFHDQTTVFYVGQSECAFTRVWDHLFAGVKGRSNIGRFVQVNWPRSLSFTIALLTSQDAAFAPLGQDRSLAEQALIAALKPCFNDVYNATPTAVPQHYHPLHHKGRFPRHLGKMIHEAELAIKHKHPTTNWSTG